MPTRRVKCFFPILLESHIPALALTQPRLNICSEHHPSLMMNLCILLFTWGISEVISCLPDAMNISTPVVFVVFGKLPLYIYMNIELVSRNNHVIIISDSVQKTVCLSSPSDYEIVFEPMNHYDGLAIKFKGVYQHLCKDRSIQRRLYEMQCIQRWLILREYMQGNIPQVSSTFFSDGDSYLFVNAHDASKRRRKCDAGEIFM